MSIITETIDNNDELMNEAFEHLKAFIGSNKFTNKDIKRSNQILKNLTKQIWTKFSMFKKRYKGIATNKGMAVIPMDKKFVDEFLKQLNADEDVISAVYQHSSNEIRKLNRAYQGVRTRKTDKETLKKRLKDSNIDPTVVMTHVINAIALETTLKYLDKDGGLDFSTIEPANKKKAMGSINKATSGFMSSVLDGVKRAASERSAK